MELWFNEKMRKKIPEIVDFQYKVHLIKLAIHVLVILC